MFLNFCWSSKEVSDLCNRRNCEMGLLKSNSKVWLYTLTIERNSFCLCNSLMVFSSLCDLLYGRPLGTPNSSKRCRQLSYKKLFDIRNVVYCSSSSRKKNKLFTVTVLWFFREFLEHRPIEGLIPSLNMKNIKLF